MDKESIYLLQCVDCNCNNCKYMVRDLSRPPAKGNAAKINYGFCDKYSKPVTFIPNVCMIETQHCFTHRKD